MIRSTGPAAERPNVIVFFTDQQRWDCSSLHGNPLELMPNFDRFAIQGTFLSHSFTNHPVCTPARAALQTGRFGTTTTCYKNRVPLPNTERTLGHLFRAAGYQTAYIGKWHLASTEPVVSSERGGYDYWLAANRLEFTSGPYRCVVYDSDEREVLLPGYRSDAITDAAIRYLEQHHREPFFLFISYLEPHQQNEIDDYPPPDGYRERYAGRWTPPDLAALVGSTYQHLAGYYGMVKRLDEGFGRLLDALKSLGRIEDTIILFTSDHGNHFKTRNSEYKRSCHESSIRVPTAIGGPGFKGGGRIDKLVAIVDLPPTILEGAGLPVPNEMQGTSIARVIRDPGAQLDRKEDEVYVQISEAQVGRSIRTSRWKFSVSAPGVDGLAATTADRYEEEFLYDLEADPYELTNLAGFESHREVSDRLRDRIYSWMKRLGEPPAEITLAQPRNSGTRRVDSQAVRS